MILVVPPLSFYRTTQRPSPALLAYLAGFLPHRRNFDGRIAETLRRGKPT